MSITSYAQNFEDVLLWRALWDVKGGFYIDIGAQDPVVDSVSKAFYDHGWNGLHVEPISLYANKLREARPNDLVLQAAITDKRGVIEFFVIPGTGLSTGSDEIAESHRKSGFRVERVTVPCITLDDVFDASCREEIHWLKIDVEGFEREVLNGWQNSRCKPWVVVIESTYPNTTIPLHEEWEQKILEKGYQYALSDGLNRYYVSLQHEDLLQAFRVGANVFDGYQLSEFNWSIAETKRTYEEKIAELDSDRQRLRTELEKSSDRYRFNQLLDERNGALTESTIDAWKQIVAQSAETLAHERATIAKEREAFSQLQKDLEKRYEGLLDREKESAERALFEQKQAFEYRANSSEAATEAIVASVDALREGVLVRPPLDSAFTNNLISGILVQIEDLWKRKIAGDFQLITSTATEKLCGVLESSSQETLSDFRKILVDESDKAQQRLNQIAVEVENQRTQFKGISSLFEEQKESIFFELHTKTEALAKVIGTRINGGNEGVVSAVSGGFDRAIERVKAANIQNSAALRSIEVKLAQLANTLDEVSVTTQENSSGHATLLLTESRKFSELLQSSNGMQLGQYEILKSAIGDVVQALEDSVLKEDRNFGELVDAVRIAGADILHSRAIAEADASRIKEGLVEAPQFIINSFDSILKDKDSSDARKVNSLNARLDIAAASIDAARNESGENFKLLIEFRDENAQLRIALEKYQSQISQLEKLIHRCRHSFLGRFFLPLPQESAWTPPDLRLIAAPKIAKKAMPEEPLSTHRLGQCDRTMNYPDSPSEDEEPAQLGWKAMRMHKADMNNILLSINSLSDLMAIDNELFVRGAYSFVLGRKPDDDGLIYYQKRLCEGYSRSSVISQLYDSSERKKKNIHIAPIAKLVADYKKSRGLMGWAMRFFLDVESDGRQERERRRSALQTNVAVSLTLERLDSLDSKISAGQRRVDSFVASLRNEGTKKPSTEKIVEDQGFPSPTQLIVDARTDMPPNRMDPRSLMVRVRSELIHG